MHLQQNTNLAKEPGGRQCPSIVCIGSHETKEKITRVKGRYCLSFKWSPIQGSPVCWTGPLEAGIGASKQRPLARATSQRPPRSYKSTYHNNQISLNNRNRYGMRIQVSDKIRSVKGRHCLSFKWSPIQSSPVCWTGPLEAGICRGKQTTAPRESYLATTATQLQIHLRPQSDIAYQAEE